MHTLNAALKFRTGAIITAIGIVNEVWIMYVAVIAAVKRILMAVETISSLVNRHPAFKMLALGFLLLSAFGW